MTDEEIHSALSAPVMCQGCDGSGERGNGSGRCWTCPDCNGSRVDVREAVQMIRAIGFLLLNRGGKTETGR